MIDVIVNPPNVQATYLDYLNTCFPHWGDASMFRWCFGRRVGTLQADLMILKNAGEIVAGSAVTYRAVMLANKPVNVGIMTGSWTLPEARGQGCFTRIIEESTRLASAKGAVLLLAFVTESNASFRRLAAAGSALFPTHYIFSNEETPMPEKAMSVSSPEDWDKAIKTILERLGKYQIGTAHFAYTLQEWRSQFIERPSQIELVEIGDENFAVIEHQGDFDRALIVSPCEMTLFDTCVKALFKRAKENQRKLFLFTTSLEWSNTCAKLGMGHAPGYITALVANRDALSQICPNAPSESENISQYFYTPTSPWFIGNWDIQSGDRM